MEAPSLKVLLVWAYALLSPAGVESGIDRVIAVEVYDGPQAHIACLADARPFGHHAIASFTQRGIHANHYVYCIPGGDENE